MRLIIAPFLFFAIKSNDYTFIILLAAVAVSTDFFDGYFARKLNSISETGKVLDPLADKVNIAVATLAVWLFGDLPTLLLILIIIRDLLIAVVGLSIIKRKHEIPVSNIWGKITVTVLTAVLIIYLFKVVSLYSIAFWLAIVFVVVSLISYFFAGLKFINNKI